MKEIYYYEWSDDRIDWKFGGVFFNILPCVDKARQCSYAVRFKKTTADFSNTEEVSLNLVKTAKDQIQLLEKLFQ
jgi:hypothetical protein